MATASAVEKVLWKDSPGICCNKINFISAMPFSIPSIWIWLCVCLYLCTNAIMVECWHRTFCTKNNFHSVVCGYVHATKIESVRLFIIIISRHHRTTISTYVSDNCNAILKWRWSVWASLFFSPSLSLPGVVRVCYFHTFLKCTIFVGNIVQSEIFLSTSTHAIYSFCLLKNKYGAQAQDRRSKIYTHTKL